MADSSQQQGTEQAGGGAGTDSGLEKTVFVLYGATGDLAKRLVLPALFRLATEGLLPDDWRLIGNGRGDVSHEDFRGRVKESLQEFGQAPEGPVWDDFAGKLKFAGGGFNEDDPGTLLDVLTDAHDELGERGQMIHYLAIPPTAFSTITRGIGAHKLVEHARVVYEKPFGTSQREFEELNELAHSVFDETAVFRIDHFLGKEGTQDIDRVRALTPLFARTWDRHSIAQVQVDIPETLDVGTRGSFYDATGAFLDMIVTHLFQIAAQVAKEPTGTEAEEAGESRERVIAAFRPLAREEVVLGQYQGYQDVDGVADGSTMDTFVAARLWVDNDRWQGVPFLLRTGKELAESHQRVSLVFRVPDDAPEGTAPAVLSYELSGDGSIGVTLPAKRPGPGEGVGSATAVIPLGDFGGKPLPAYSRLVHDVMRGERAQFTTPEGLAHVWAAVTPFLSDRPDPETYPTGSWGPAAADALAGETGWLLGS